MSNSSIASWAARTLLPAMLLTALHTQLASASQELEILSADASHAAAQFEDALRPRYLRSGDQTRFSLADRMAHHNVPGVAVAIIEGGEIVFSAGFGVLQTGGTEPVNADTLFSAGSVSKIATAALALRLSADGQLDLDRPVAEVLTSWSLPDAGEFSGTALTPRMILSHTSGLNLHGFGDFQPGAPLPTVIETLNGEPPATHDPLTYLFEPASGYKYSGGAYTLAQLLISDVTGQDFTLAAETHVFAPLGLTRSSFENPLPESVGNIAKAHNRDGAAVALPRGYEAMPEMAASGLWTSANDLGGLVAALIESYRSVDGFLPQPVAQDMMSRVSPSQHGLGPRLEQDGDAYYFHHAGSNNSYQTWIEGHLTSGNGLVVLTNGAGGNGLHQEIRNAVADTMDWPVNQAIIVPDLTLTTSVLENFTGQYVVDATFPASLRQQMVGSFFDADVEIIHSDNALFLQIVGTDRRVPLIATSPTRFLMVGLNMRIGVAELAFHRDARGETTGMSFHLANAQSFYQRR
jgi:CubicO group peptidase (beta-lactamase class C family)